MLTDHITTEILFAARWAGGVMYDPEIPAHFEITKEEDEFGEIYGLMRHVGTGEQFYISDNREEFEPSYAYGTLYPYTHDTGTPKDAMNALVDWMHEQFENAPRDS